MACKSALAATANRPQSDIAVVEALRGQAGISVTMTLAGAEKPWSCFADGAGKVQGLQYMGEG